ncbi:MAG: hypothetical protein J2P26_02160 [Nocardiopsaceae bacterium]|nr:hypothetical protein [Nocardiopsaceae bacterium]
MEVFNLASLSPVATLSDPLRRAVGGVAISPDGGTVAAATSGTTRGMHLVEVWNVSSPEVTATLAVPGRLGRPWRTQYQAGMPMALGGTTFGAMTLAVSDGVTTRAYGVESSSLRPAAAVAGGLVAISPDGSLFATTDPRSQYTVDLWNSRTGQKAAALTVPAAQPPQPAAAVFNASGDSFALSCNNGHTYVWNLARSR